MNTPIVQVMCDLEQCEQLIATHEAQVGPTWLGLGLGLGLGLSPRTRRRWAPPSWKANPNPNPNQVGQPFDFVTRIRLDVAWEAELPVPAALFQVRLRAS